MKRPKVFFSEETLKYLETNFNGKKSIPSPFLLESQKAWKNAEAIRDLHYLRYGLYEVMEECPKEDLADYDELCDGIEECLQDLWNFPRDYRRVRFWDRPRCKCPKMDNEDRYPTGMYSVADGCYHWIFK